MTTYHLRNESGIEVFTGTISPAPGGGSQPTFRTVAKAVNFNTPNVLADGGGVVVATLGDREALVAGWFSIPTAFDGTTPKLHVSALGVTDNDIFSVDATEADTPYFGTGELLNAQNIPSIIGNSTYAIFKGSTGDLIVYLDDGSGGDPGGAAGESVVNLLISSPAAP